jgi:predicted RecA/RadA family phage recombinase
MGLNDFKHPGERLTLPAPSGGVVHRVGYLIGSLFVIALDDKLEGELFVGRVVGVHELAKKTAEAWASGDRVYWDDTAKLATNVGPADAFIGAAEGPAANPSVASLVRLNGIGQQPPITTASLPLFISAERTGTGAPENIAHGLGVVPSAVFPAPTDLAPATLGEYTVVEGAHDATNVILTVTLDKKYKVLVLA